MLKKYRVYFKEGYQASKSVLKNKGNLLRYYLIYLIDFLGTVLFPLKPITSVAVYRMIDSAAKKEDISITKALVSVDEPKSYWALMWAGILKFIMVLAGVIGIALATLGLLYLGYAIYVAFPSSDPNIPYIFGIPGALALVVFLLVVLLATMPLSYISHSNLSIKTTRLLDKSFNGFKFGGKKQYIAILITKFFLSFIYNLVASLVLSLIGNLANDFSELISIILIILFVVLYVIFITKVNLAFDIAKINLLNDILFDNVTGQKKYTGIKFDKIEDTKKLNKLERLFESDGVMLTDNRYDLIRGLRDINGTDTEVSVSNIDNEQPISEGPQTEEVVSGPVVELPVEEEVAPVIETPTVENVNNVEEHAEEAPIHEEVSHSKGILSFMDKIKNTFKNITNKKEKNEDKAIENIVLEDTTSNEIVEDEALDATTLEEPIVEAEVTEQSNPEAVDLEGALSIEEPVIMTEQEIEQQEQLASEEALLEEEVVEEVIYVDEDGNPVELTDDQEVVEEIIYVDEDGNPVELDENHEVVEEIIEKPKRGRKKKTEEDGE